MNVNNSKFQNINLINCTNGQKDYFNTSYFNTSYTRDYRPFSKVTDCYTTFFLCNSSFIKIFNININATVNTSFTAILVVNVKNTSEMINVKVQVNSHCTNLNKCPIEISGLKVLLCFYDKISDSGKLTIDNFYYSNYRTCEHHLLCAIATVLLRNDRFNVKNQFKLEILNSVFNNLKNSSVLCSYGETKENLLTLPRSYRFITIRNSTFSDNTGNLKLNMFNIELKHFEQLDDITSQIISLKQLYHHVIVFDKCMFKRNTNMKALIYIRPSNAEITTGYIRIINSTFSDNKNMTFIKIELDFQTTHYKIIHVSLTSVNVSSNENHHVGDLILIVNGLLRFHCVFFKQNDYYDNIVYLQSSLLYIEGYNDISSNYARHIIKAQSNSFLFIHYLATANVSHNVVYKVIKLVSSFEKHSTPICPLQVYNSWTLHLAMDVVNCTLLLSYNMEMLSKILPNEIVSYASSKCDWFGRTILQMIKADVQIVYHKIIIRVNNTFVNKTTQRLVPLSVCPCLSNSNYSCYMANVYAVYPGQILHMNLIISPKWSELTSTIIVANTKDDDCSILDSYQLSQTHTNNDCNKYSYTIWPNNEHTTECKLFIGLSEMPEMFYVQMKPCPMGFTLQNDKKACYCDPLLNNDDVSITSCDINDRTILRPANSWISAVTVNNSHSYNVSSQCPFDYCLPYSSHLNLSNPDSQCQFKRSGVVCAQCQQGLSTVFGSSRCKQCSNFYLLLIIPIAIAGVVLVIMLFTFNLTVTNGIINTLIFYVNIISINYSLFCFDSNSPDCTVLSLLNLDLGIETCFYDGMDGYTKMWLQLVFPSYLMIIAFTLIIGSRYSSKLQRLTANRVLKVLATLFLLSYTKMLLTVCQVLFTLSSVVHLPSEHTTLFWTVDTGVELFGAKFCILYTVSLCVFLILLFFNTLLLFPRTVLRWKFISYFKPLLDAYFGPYKLKYPFWTGLQLLIRSCFFGLSALSRRASLFCGAVLVGILLCTHGIVYPFKSRFKNIQESLVLLDLSAVYVTALYNEYENSKYIIRLLIITVLAYFIVLIFCHCIMLMYGDVIKGRANKIKQMLMKRIRRKQTYSESLQLEELSAKIPDVTFNYEQFREPLIAID